MKTNILIRCIDSNDSQKAALVKKAIRHNAVFASIYKMQRAELTAKAQQTFDCLALAAKGNKEGKNDNTLSKLNTLAQSFEQEQRAAKSMLNNALNRGRYELHFSKSQYLAQLATVEDFSAMYTAGRLSIDKIFKHCNTLCRQYYK